MMNKKGRRVMEQTIQLEFNMTITRLAGYDYGKSVYENQVRDKINYTSPIIRLVFPNRIVKIASSFVQGLFKGIVEQIGLDEIGKKVIVQAASPQLEESIMSNLL